MGDTVNKKIFVAALVLLLMEGCSTTKNTAIYEKAAFHIRVEAGAMDKITIPDPINSENINTIILNTELMKAKDSLYLTDLSFAGLKEKVKITAFAIGYVTSMDTSFAHIVYADSADNGTESSGASVTKEKDVNGNCLILSASTKSNDKGQKDSKHYIVVLDYVNKKSFSVETSLAASWSHLPVITISDLTGDGLTDIIVSNVLNGYRSGTSCEIFSFYNDGLKKIYSNMNHEDDYFTGHLEDDYKAVIECKQDKFTQQVDLLDIGYKKHDLEISEAPVGDIGDETQFCRCYQNGKIKKRKLARNVYVAALDEADGIKLDEGKNSEIVVRFKYKMYIGKWNDLGSAYAYMQYNKSKKYMEIVKASFEPVKLKK